MLQQLIIDRPSPFAVMCQAVFPLIAHLEFGAELDTKRKRSTVSRLW